MLPLLFCTPAFAHDDTMIMMQNVSPTCSSEFVQMAEPPTQQALDTLGITCEVGNPKSLLVIYGSGPTAHAACELAGLE
jgi:hypothetical protein